MSKYAKWAVVLLIIWNVSITVVLSMLTYVSGNNYKDIKSHSESLTIIVKKTIVNQNSIIKNRDAIKSHNEDLKFLLLEDKELPTK